ncbi:hypothetical protein BG90_4953 [Burkholderia oklahomensis C6786]|nr:hypothetical protein BG90_4953 [Burkholderia oklahomensis C6786]
MRYETVQSARRIERGGHPAASRPDAPRNILFIFVIEIAAVRICTSMCCRANGRPEPNRALT